MAREYTSGRMAVFMRETMSTTKKKDMECILIQTEGPIEDSGRMGSKMDRELS